MDTLESPASAVTEAEPTRKPGRKRSVVKERTLGRSISDRFNPAAVVEAAKASVLNGSRKRLEEDFQFTEREARIIREVADMPPERFREHLAAQVDSVLNLTITMLREQLGNIPARDLPICFGILNDHSLKLRGITQQVTHQTNIQINGMSREDAMKAIAGQSGNRSLVPAKTEEPRREAAVIDLMPAGQSESPGPIGASA